MSRCPNCGSTIAEGPITGGLCGRCLLMLGLGETSPDDLTTTVTPGSRRTLAEYEITESLGRGGMGEVFRARDTKLDRDVALKVLPADAAADPTRLARFRQEARLLAQLDHPNIAGIYDLIESGEDVALVLELVEGRTLAERLRAGALPLREALELGRQIASALEAAHRKGVVHRDLKPANVMLKEDGTVKVLDFGIAAVVASGGAAPDQLELTATGTIVGTVPYMSPEQVRGETLDARSDVWSFSCVLFEMLSGERAFARPTAAETMTAILEHEPATDSLPRSLPPEVRTLLGGGLHKELDRRIQTMAEVSRSIAQTLGLLRQRPARWSSLAAGLIGLAVLLGLSEGGALSALIRTTTAEIPPLLADGGRLAALAAALAAVVLVVRRAWRAFQLGRHPEITLVALPLAALLVTGLLAGRYVTAAAVPAAAVLLWRVRRRVITALLIALLVGGFFAEGWWAAHSERRDNRRVDVYVVLPFAGLNDETREDLLRISERYRSTFETVFRDIESVHVLPRIFDPERYRTLPAQCSYRRVGDWLGESPLAPDIVLCGTVDLFDDPAGETGVILVSRLNRVREAVLEPFDDLFRQQASFADVEWLALRAALRVLRVIADEPTVSMSPEDGERITRRILEQYETFLTFREQGTMQVREALEGRSSAEKALDAYVSPVDLESYAERHRTARSELHGRAAGE